MAMSLQEFKEALGLNIIPYKGLDTYLTPAEKIAVANASKNPMNYMTGANTDSGSQFFNLGAAAKNKSITDPIVQLKNLMESTPDAYKSSVLAKYGVSQASWDKYWNDAAKSYDSNSTWADKWYSPENSNIRTPLDWLSMNAKFNGDVSTLSDAQLNELLGNYNTYKTQKEGGGFLDSVLPVLGTIAGIATGNPYLGALAGGLSSGISTGSPLAGILGAAGGYFGASGVADAGGFMNYINNTISSIGNIIMHPIDSLTSALGNIISGFGGGSTAGSGSGAWTGLANSGQSAGDILSGWSPVGSSGGWGSAAGVASTINDAAQTASSVHDVLNGNQVPGGASGNLTPTTGGGLTTAQGAGAGATAAGTGVAGSAVTGVNGVLQSAGNTAATTGLGSVSTGLSGGDIAIGSGALGLGGAGAGVLQNAAGSISGGLLTGTAGSTLGSIVTGIMNSLSGTAGSTLGSTVTGIMNSLFGSGTGTGGLLGGSGISDSAMNLLSGIFGQMNSSDLAALQDKILKQNQMLTNYLPSTQWRDTLLNHLNTIVTNPGALVSSGPYKDYLDQATNSIERKAVAQGYGGVGQSSNTKNMVAQGLISNMNDIISKDYGTSVNALQPYFQVGTQGTTNLTNYSNSGLPSSVATSDLASILKIAQGAAPIASGLLKSIF